MGKKKGKKSDKQPSESGDSASGTAPPQKFEKPEGNREDDFPPVGGSVWGRGRGRGGVQPQHVVEEPPAPGGRGQRVGGGDFEGPGLENITKGRGGRAGRGRGSGRGGAGDGPSQAPPPVQQQQPPPVQQQQRPQKVDEPEQGLPAPRKTSGPRHPGQQVPPPELQQPPQLAAPPRRWGAPQPVQMPTPQQGPPVQMPGPPQPRVPAPQQMATTVPQPPHPHPRSQTPQSEGQPPSKKVAPPDSIQVECLAMGTEDDSIEVGCSAMETKDGDVAKMTAALSQTKITGSGNGSHLMIPHRKKIGPIVGTKGRRILIEVNHLQLQLRKTNAIAIHYDVSFKPELPKKLLRFAMEEFRRRHFPKNYPAFDGRKNLYSCGYLPFKLEIRDTVLVMDEERQRDKEFDITIKYASEVDMSVLSTYTQSGRVLPQEAIQALDIVLRNPASMNFTAVGRSFFTAPTDRIIDLGDGLELWYGFYQSAILGWKPYLNIDVAHKGFPKAQHLVEFMVNLRGEGRGGPELLRTPLQPWEKQNLEKFVKGLKVEYQITNQPNTRRTYKVNSVKGPCSSERFKMENGSEMTVGEYFAKEKRVPLRFPEMPCIHVGNDQKTIYLPLEFCRIPAGQVVHSKLNETQTANMVRAAAKPADERKRRIMDAMRQANFNADKCIQEFGITVSQEFTKIDARILDPPKLEYSNNECIVPNKGVWRPSRFLKSNSLKEWKILNLDGRTRDDALWNFADLMNKIGRRLGIAIDKPTDVRTVNLGKQISKQPIIDYFVASKTTQLIVVVINDRDPGIYAKVKQAAELNVGVLTQCIKSKTMFKMNDATCSNILLKVNSKLNGVNHQIDKSCRPKIFSRPVMIVGADVTHPSPDQKTIPSVAAVAASHDPTAFQYNMLWRLQPPRQEMIEDLEEMMKIQLRFFFQRTKHKPEKIIFYRDGVSEGQFSQVLDVELKAIRRACSALDPSFKPPITFLVVQKRHHTRFFPTNPRDEDGRNKNVPAGTIVDTEITHPREMDFYLVSHASLQGTSRPTKYHKLWDDNDIDENDLEELTYYLCHLFSRCTRSVSYPAPTYYAHLAAFRARSYIEGSPISMTNLPNEQRQRTIQTAIVENSPMFFV